MKIARRVVGVLLGLVLVLVVAELVASESGEVVVLTTTDPGGQTHETRLWVVDYAGGPWLRAGSDAQAWYARLLEDPGVWLERDGRREAFTASPDPRKREAVNLLMREKYGWADRYVSLVFGRDDAVPIRLEPREPEAGGEA